MQNVFMQNDFKLVFRVRVFTSSFISAAVRLHEKFSLFCKTICKTGSIYCLRNSFFLFICSSFWLLEFWKSLRILQFFCSPHLHICPHENLSYKHNVFSHLQLHTFLHSYTSLDHKPPPNPMYLVPPQLNKIKNRLTWCSFKQEAEYVRFSW